MDAPTFPSRREALGAAAGLAAILVARPASATPQAMDAAMRALTGGAAPREGGITLEVPSLVENGNSVPVTITVESAMSDEDLVRRIAVFNEKNPQPNVAIFHLTRHAGRASVSTRMRMADSQRIVALAEMADGSWRSDSADVIVTLAACLES